MTYEQKKALWYSDPKNLEALHSVLGNPTLVAAMNLVREGQSPARSLPAMGNPTLAASVFHFQSGVFDAFRALDALTREEQKQSQPTPRYLEPEN